MDPAARENDYLSVPLRAAMNQSKPPKRVLYINHEVECGGAEHSLLELIRGLDRQKFEPHLVCSMEGPLTDEARALGAEVHLVPMLFQGKFGKLWGMFRASLKIRRLIKQIGIQLVHTNSMIAGYCGVFAAKLCQVPSIWHVRDIGYPEAAKKICSQADRVVANSKATAASLAIPSRLKDRLHVIYNGVGRRFFEQPSTRQQVRSELKVAANENLVGIFGRLDPWKGHADLITAAKHILHEHPLTTFVVVGDTLFDGSRSRHKNYREELEHLARDRGVWGKVQFLGHRTDVPELMAAMDVIVQPSSSPEPFGRAIAEAQAIGVPVIGSALGGIPELIEDGASGILFPAGDSRSLGKEVIRVLGDSDLASRLATTGRRCASERFTQERYVQAIEAIYDDL